eukprot:UN23372
MFEYNSHLGSHGNFMTNLSSYLNSHEKIYTFNKVCAEEYNTTRKYPNRDVAAMLKIHDSKDMPDFRHYPDFCGAYRSLVKEIIETDVSTLTNLRCIERYIIYYGSLILVTFLGPLFVLFAVYSVFVPILQIIF